ncbi:MAG: PrsW family glutamic-type intramembrane protease [Chloroflexota bacterium]
METFPTPSTPAPGAPRPLRLGSALQLGLSGLALVLILGLALLLTALMLITLIMQGPGSDTLSMALTAAGLGAGVLFLLPAVYYSLVDLLGRPAPSGLAALRRLRPWTWPALFPLLLGLGHLISQAPMAAWLALPPVHVLTVGIPIAWMLFLGIHGLPLGKDQRFWGVFTSGMLFGPFLISIVEIAAALGMVVLAAVYISTQPALVSALTQLAEQLQGSTPDPEALVEMFGPYLSSPSVMLAVIAFGAVLVPLIEEALKPIGVWLLAGRRLTPAAGFAAGAVSGAGYAFMESLLLTSGGEQWASLMLARIGTSAIHILNTALMGWALVSAWRERRYLRLGLVYLAAVGLHGLWNGLTLYTAFQSLQQSIELGPAAAAENSPLAMLTAGGLMALAFLALFILVAVNRRLNRQFKQRSASNGTIPAAAGEAEIFPGSENQPGPDTRS